MKSSSFVEVFLVWIGSTIGTFIAGGFLIGLLGMLTKSEPIGICSGSGPLAVPMTLMLFGLFPLSPIAGVAIAVAYYERQTRDDVRGKSAAPESSAPH